MKPSTFSMILYRLRISVSVATVVLAAGCHQTAPVAVTPQEQLYRVTYNCPDGRSLGVTRIHGNNAVTLLVDGATHQLTRDAAMTSAERYTNRVQTLTFSGNNASYDVLGRTSSGLCTPSGTYGPAMRPADGSGPNFSD